MLFTSSTPALLATISTFTALTSGFPTNATNTNTTTPQPHAATQQIPIRGLPGCTASDRSKPTKQDPSQAPSTSRFTDGQGIFLGSDCETGHRSNKCRTDYFLVGTQLSYTAWSEVIGDIQCAGNDSGATCSQELSSELQKCETTTWSVNAGVSAQADAIFAQLGFEVGATVGQSYESCSSNSTAQTCTWNDDRCHSVYAAQRVTSAYGYKRRSCRSPAAAEGSDGMGSPRRADGWYTRGMTDFVVPLPDGAAVSCRGTCESSYNPGPLPELSQADQAFKYLS